MPKSTFAASGTSETVNAKTTVVYYADFTTGSGSGSAQLQVKLGGDWVPADDAVTATMATVEATEAASVPLEYRWNVTRSGGTIYTYLF
jgi:hypothetical protein